MNKSEAVQKIHTLASSPNLRIENVEDSCVLIEGYLKSEWTNHSKEMLGLAKQAKAKQYWSSSVLKGILPVFAASITLGRYADLNKDILTFILRLMPTPVIDDVPPTPVIDDVPPVVIPDRIVCDKDITTLITINAWVHKQAERIIRYMSLRKHVFVWGSPGAGKSHMFAYFAEQMGLAYLCLTLNEDSTKSEILGNKSLLNGEFFASKFVKLWEFGGVILLDEVGLGTGGIVNLLNGAMAQGYIEFPDGRRVARHQNTFLVFADNSNLWGDDELFKERNDLGAAFRDRLSYIKFEYDHELEVKILTKIWGDRASAKAWHRMILKMREILKSAQVPLFASPRFSFAASEGIVKLGETFKQVCETNLWQGIDENKVSSIKDQIESLWV